MDSQIQIRPGSERTKISTRDLEIEALLHPGRVYERPADVVRDDALSLNEKRAILASWASDACAVEAAPELRCVDAGRIVRWDEVMEALRMLDNRAADKAEPARLRAQKMSKSRRSGMAWLGLCS